MGKIWLQPQETTQLTKRCFTTKQRGKTINNDKFNSKTDPCQEFRIKLTEESCLEGWRGGQEVLTSALMSLNLVMKACLTTSTATSDASTIITSGNSTHRWSENATILCEHACCGRHDNVQRRDVNYQDSKRTVPYF